MTELPGGGYKMGFAALGYEDARRIAEGLDAQVAAYVNGQLVLDIGDNAIRPVYSSTKGILGAVLALMVDRGQLDLDARVASIWPDFAAAGKGTVTVRQAMSHQAGVAVLDGPSGIDDLRDHAVMAARVAAQSPKWNLGEGFSYHGITIGTIGEEIVRRVSGQTVAEIFTQDFGQGLDLYLGSNSPEDIVQVEPPSAEELRAQPAASGDAHAAPDADAEDAPGPPTPEMTLPMEVLRSGQPGATATGTARGLAGFYSRLPSLLSSAVLKEFSREQVSGRDLILGREARYGVVFELPLGFGGPGAFGHGGAGGSAALLDGPVAFAFVPYRLPSPQILPRVVAILEAVRNRAGVSA